MEFTEGSKVNVRCREYPYCKKEFHPGVVESVYQGTFYEILFSEDNSRATHFREELFAEED